VKEFASSRLASFLCEIRSFAVNELALDDRQSQPAFGIKSVLLTVLMCTLIGVLIGVPWIDASYCLLGVIGWSGLLVQATRFRPRIAGLTSFLIGCLALGIAFHWAPFSICDTTHLSQTISYLVFAGLVAWESLAFAAIGYAASRLHRVGASWIWAAVPVWVLIEFYHPQIFGWSLAHTFLHLPSVIQVAELTGAAGVSAIIMLASTAIARGLLGWDAHGRREIVVATIGLVAINIWGGWIADVWAKRLENASVLRVAAVQVDPTYTDSIDSVQPPVDLYVWPESTLGHYHISLRDFRDELNTVVNSEAPNPALDPYPNNRAQLLAGGKTYEDGGRDQGPYRNTAFLIDSSKSITGRYVKRTLMPIGEYVPGEEYLPILRDWAAVDTELVRGTSNAPIRLTGGEQVGVLVCYEDMEIENSRLTTKEGAQCFVSLINGSGFRDPDTLRQHLWLAQLRAVENRRAMIRCAATGVTCLIQPDGRITARLPIDQPNVLVANVPLENHLTVFTRFGNWFIHLAMCITIAITIAAIRTTRANLAVSRGV
jgi:apolipoprotein N-acyltransferase